MAMYEHLGFCPSNSFGFHPNRGSKEGMEVMSLLGDRPGYMVYSENGFAWGSETVSVVEAILGDPKGLGTKIAYCLNHLIPDCAYAEKEKKILITDVINPGQISGYIFTHKEYRKSRIWGFVNPNGLADTRKPISVWCRRHLMFNQDYLVVIEDQEDLVQVWIFKIPPERD